MPLSCQALGLPGLRTEPTPFFWTQSDEEASPPSDAGRMSAWGYPLASTNRET